MNTAEAVSGTVALASIELAAADSCSSNDGVLASTRVLVDKKRMARWSRGGGEAVSHHSWGRLSRRP